MSVDPVSENPEFPNNDQSTDNEKNWDQQKPGPVALNFSEEVIDEEFDEDDFDEEFDDDFEEEVEGEYDLEDDQYGEEFNEEFGHLTENGNDEEQDFDEEETIDD